MHGSRHRQPRSPSHLSPLFLPCLQMVNTVLKRVGQQVLVSLPRAAHEADRQCRRSCRGLHSMPRPTALHCTSCLAPPQSPGGTPLPSPSPTTFRPWRPSGSSDNVAAAAAAALESHAAQQAAASGSASAAASTADEGGASEGVSQVASEADLAGPAGQGGLGDDLPVLPSPSQHAPLSPLENAELAQALSESLAVPAPAAASGASPPGAGALGPGQAAYSGAATSPTGSVAAAADAAAAAADIAELQAALPRIQTSPPSPSTATAAAAAAAAAAAGSGSDPEGFVAAAVEADARTAQLASLAEQSDLRGLERALDSLPQVGWASWQVNSMLPLLLHILLLLVCPSCRRCSNLRRRVPRPLPACRRRSPRAAAPTGRSWSGRTRRPTRAGELALATAEARLPGLPCPASCIAPPVFRAAASGRRVMCVLGPSTGCAQGADA